MAIRFAGPPVFRFREPSGGESGIDCRLFDWDPGLARHQDSNFSSGWESGQLSRRKLRISTFSYSSENFLRFAGRAFSNRTSRLFRTMQRPPSRSRQYFSIRYIFAAASGLHHNSASAEFNSVDTEQENRINGE